MIVSEIWVYPIKGLGGHKVSEAYAMESGFENDRRYMLVDKNHKFISQRSHPALATLSVSLVENVITITDKRDNSSFISFTTHDRLEGHELHAKVWSSEVSSLMVSDEVNVWLSDYLDDEVKLVVQAEFANRKRHIPFRKAKIGMSYADGYPFLVLSMASVADLSQRIGSPVDFRQFRANIIIDDCPAYGEDMLDSFAIDSVNFRMVKPCKRCPVININQDTGAPAENLTKELVRYRKVDNSVIFGMNAANLSEGLVKCGSRLIEI